MSSIPKWALVLLTSLIFVISDSLSAYWGKTGSLFSMLVVLVTAPIGYTFFAFLNKRISLGISSGLVNLLMVAGNVIIGLLLFREHLNLKQIVGLTLACISILMMS